jgi:hypothetical protein
MVVSCQVVGRRQAVNSRALFPKLVARAGRANEEREKRENGKGGLNCKMSNTSRA